MIRSRFPALLVRSAALLFFAASSVVVVVATMRMNSPLMVLAGAAGMFIGMIVCTRFCSTGRSLTAALFLALLARILFLVYYPASDDVNRYVWEGRIQHHGFNPFITPPDAPQTAPLRNELWKGINHKELTTIYWPFAQILFKGAAFVAPGPMGFKALVVLFDIATLIVLLLMARQRNFPLRHLLLYAMNPLVIVFISGQGHVESVMVFLITCAVFLSSGKYRGFAYALLSCAILTKIHMLILVPLFIRKIGLRPMLFLLAPLLLFLPYQADPSAYFATPVLFANAFSHNGPLYALLADVCGLGHQPALIVLAVVLASGSAAIFFFTPSLLKSTGMILGLVILCLPTVHPWYFLLLTPHLVFFRQWSWLTLHLTAFLMLFFFDTTVSLPVLHNKYLLMTLEYLPFAVIFLIEVITQRRRWPVCYEKPCRLSVIIPARNEQEQIAACIQSAAGQNVAADIIVVDGGSTDSTMAIAAAIEGVTVIKSSPGRGVQIAAGMRKAQGDVIVVLHADSRLMPGSLKQVIDVLSDNPESAGGSMGAKYNTSENRFRFTSLLNMMRARFSGISFGDQAQFFRRAALPEGFPDYVLMEDVELSMRLKEQGTVMIIPCGVISSSRRWIQYGYLNNFITVITLTSVFLVLRAFGLIHDKGEWFRKMYYRKAAS